MILLSEFSISLLYYDTHPPTNEFLDLISSHYFVPCTLNPTKMKSNSKTLIDNIFFYLAAPTINSGNLTASISDHRLQFLVAPNV